MSKFLVNKTQASISLCNNSIIVPIGGSIPISDADAEHKEVIDAVTKQWVSLIDEQPAVAKPFKPELTFENAKPQGSLTIPGKEPVAPVEEVKQEAEAPANKRGGKKLGTTE